MLLYDRHQTFDTSAVSIFRVVWRNVTVTVLSVGRLDQGQGGFKESERVIMWWSGVVAARILYLEIYIGANGLLCAPTVESRYAL